LGRSSRRRRRGGKKVYEGKRGESETHRKGVFVILFYPKTPTREEKKS